MTFNREHFVRDLVCFLAEWEGWDDEHDDWMQVLADHLAVGLTQSGSDIASLCDEIERLRRSAVVVQSVRESELLAVINERNAATAEIERLRGEKDARIAELEANVKHWHTDIYETVMAERNAALAELAGLSADHLQANLDLLGREQRVTALYEELKAWRACADRYYNALPTARVTYERLAKGDS